MTELDDAIGKLELWSRGEVFPELDMVIEAARGAENVRATAKGWMRAIDSLTVERDALRAVIVRAVDKFEDEHSTTNTCLADALAAVPKDALDAARMVDDYLRGDTAQAERARIWDEGWQALVEQEQLQRADPSHPITRENPYRMETNE